MAFCLVENPAPSVRIAHSALLPPNAALLASPEELQGAIAVRLAVGVSRLEESGRVHARGGRPIGQTGSTHHQPQSMSALIEQHGWQVPVQANPTGHFCGRARADSLAFRLQASNLDGAAAGLVESQRVGRASGRSRRHHVRHSSRGPADGYKSRVRSYCIG